MVSYIEARCMVCHLILCCKDCRWRHEKNAHGLSFDCPICRGFKFLCQPEALNQEFVDHLTEEHLPLHCNKCEQKFNNMEDLMNIDKCTSISELVNKDTSVQSKDVEEKFDFIYEKSKSTNEENCEGIILVNKNTKTAIITPIVRKKHLVDYESSDSDNDQEAMKTLYPKIAGKTPKLKRQRSQTPHVKKFLSMMRQKMVEEDEKTIDVNKDSPKSTLMTDNDLSSQKEMTTPTSHIPNLLKLAKTVTTSTPTHPIIGSWTMFPEQGADSPLSEIENAESPAQSTTNEASKSEVPPKLKSIISTNSRRLGSQDSSEKHVTFESGVTDGSMKKKVTFADNTVFEQEAKMKRVFRKPKRMLTPGPQKPRYVYNPRFQALINRFENQGIIMTRTPITNREKPQESTPPVGELGNMPARAINFKDDSPVVEEHYSKESNDSFKTCIGSPDMSSAITALTSNIAGSLQTCLHSALKTTEEETEIQFKFVITKKKVSVKRIAEDVEEKTGECYNSDDQNKENIWSSVARAVKNVFWGEHGPHFASITPHRSLDSTSSSASKRKIEDLSDTELSPLNHKRHKYNGRIRGRPPLRKFGVSALRPSKSAEQYSLMKDMGDDPMNLSF